MDSNIPNDVLIRWKNHGFEWYSLLSYEITPVHMVGTYILDGMKTAAMSIFSLIPQPITDRLFK